MVEKLVELYKELYESGVELINRSLPFSSGSKSAVLDLDFGLIGVFIDSTHLTLAEETCCIAHEIGHVATGTTHKLNSPYELITRHEYRANKWAIKKLVPKDELDEAVRQGYTEVWELADYFGVTEDFMAQTIHFYQNIVAIGFE